MTLFRGSGEVGSGEQIDYLRSKNNLSDVDNVPEARSNLGLKSLSSISGLTPADSTFIVGDGVNWVAESGATVRTSLGLNNVPNIDTTNASNVELTDSENHYPNDNVESALEELGQSKAEIVDNVSDLQSGSFESGLNRIWLSGYYGIGTAGGGPLYRDSGDMTTADNGGTVFVDADGVRWKRADTKYVSLSNFGVLADSDGTTGNGTDNTTALQAFASWLSGKGGYTITAPSGTVRLIAGNGGRQIFDLDGTAGVDFEFGDTEFFDDATYDQVNDETGYIWHLNNCTDISITIRKVISEIITQGEAGLRTVFCENACRRVSVYCTQEGGGRVLRAKQDLGDAESTRSSHLFVKATTTDVDEPVNFSYSGDQSEAWIINSGGGRPFFIANVRDVNVHMRTEDQSAAGIISCHGDGAGRTGADNIRIHWDQLTGTSYPSALTLVDLRWVYSGTTSARARDIHFDFNIENPPAGTDAWNHVLRFNKTDSNGNPETTSRGHVAERITIQGSGNFPNGNQWTTEASGTAFSGSDRVSGLVVGPLAASSRHNVDLQFFENGDIQNPVTFNSCRMAGAFFENDAVFINCDASGTLSTNDATDHVYINCSIGDSSSSDGGKTLLNTDISGLRFFRVAGSNVNIQGVKNGLAADSRLDNESINWGIDQVNNLLEVKVKYDDGTTKTGSISLS